MLLLAEAAWATRLYSTSSARCAALPASLSRSAGPTCLGSPVTGQRTTASEVVAPGVAVLRTAQAFRLGGREQLHLRPVGAADAVQRRFEPRPAIGRRHGEQTGFALYHHRARFGERCGDQRDPGGRNSAIWRTHSAPARVLPNPRPTMIIQIRQSPSGTHCSLRASSCQWNWNSAFSLWSRALAMSGPAPVSSAFSHSRSALDLRCRCGCARV